MVPNTENPPGHSATVLLRRFENESQDVGAAAALDTEPSDICSIGASQDVSTCTKKCNNRTYTANNAKKVVHLEDLTAKTSFQLVDGEHPLLPCHEKL
ncbi:uncharacterized protein Bfra_011364 [Botrytis fragariae]|uniref:Uncharacterized protein n=1 Tax=Botrytis fragariae TaxID=1964551 RepID=A0A8H6AY07_9HELO|nr:uncharacterized protein Bfra_011364 [Botrytis fragariae]KAF5875602.1 hypothetical protein Bfra_011364 [Botrytis fragariae]